MVSLIATLVISKIGQGNHFAMFIRQDAFKVNLKEIFLKEILRKEKFLLVQNKNEIKIRIFNYTIERIKLKIK